MNLKATIISLVSVFVVGLTAILLYCFWPAIKGTVDNSKYYTQEEIQESYDKGFEDGCKTETELTGQVNYYKGLVDEYYIQVNILNDEITMSTNTNRDYATQVSNLELQRLSLQEQVDNLTSIKLTNEETINQLNEQVTTLRNEVLNLENSDLNNNEIINQKNVQITNLQNTIFQLQRTNQLNVETINNLNNQILNLNSQISDMSLQIQNNSSNVSVLTNKIAELEKSVAYYEQYIANLENGEQVVATFEFNGSVYNIQIVNKNDTVSVVNPTSTDYVIFNYWMVNGEQIDLSTYQITSNVKIIANITLKYDVKFMVDNAEYDSQIVIKNNYATMPVNPEKSGYDFKGWTLNGIDIIDPETINITENTTFVAKFEKYHTVTFVYEDITLSTQSIKNEGFAEMVNVDSTDYKVFNGWTLNGVIVDVSTVKITANTIFIADITYYFDVTFTVDDTTFETLKVENNSLALLSTTPTKQHYDFKGWSIDGINIIDITTYTIHNNTTFIALFEVHKYKVQVVESYVMFGSPVVLYTTEIAYGETIGTLDYTPTKTDYKFIGYKSYGMSSTSVDITTYVVTADVKFIPEFESVVSYVKVYDGDTLLYDQKISTGSTYNLSSIKPVGRSGMRFLGWYTSNRAGQGYLQGQTNAIKLTASLGSYTAGKTNKTYYAYYEHVCMGGFATSDGKTLELTYRYNSSTSQYYIEADASWDASFEYGTYSFSGTYSYTSGSTTYTGTYNSSNDTWTFVKQLYKSDGSKGATYTYTLTRTANSCGASSFSFK